MATHKVEGFNLKEQKLFNRFLDGEPHNIRALKRVFWKDATNRCEEVYDPGWGEGEVDSQAQSYVRNSIRRLIRDGWVEQVSRGTYQITSNGKRWVKKGVSVTSSKIESQRGKGGGRPRKKETDKATKKAKTTKAKTTKAKTTKATKKAKTAKAKTAKASKKAKTAKASNGASNGAQRKVSSAKIKKMRFKNKIEAARERLASLEAAALN